MIPCITLQPSESPYRATDTLLATTWGRDVRVFVVDIEGIQGRFPGQM